MTKIKPLRLVGSLTFALSVLSISVNNAVANDFTTVSSLPVITDDCGGDGCRDQRNMTADELKAMLADAAYGATHTEENIAGNRADKSVQYYGSGDGTQVVYLNFDQSSPTFQAVPFSGVPETFTSHIYTQEERDEIQARIEADYEGFDIEFTQSVPESGEFSTLNFECQDEDGMCIDFFNGILFGRAQSIDIGNRLRDDSAFVDANLWEVVVQIDPTGDFLTNLTGIEVENGDVHAALSKAIVHQAANTGAHELGHNLGLRHHDSFGAIGSGIPTTGTPSPDAFYPVFEGLAEGDETTLHTMASGASVGTTLADGSNSDRFLSERSVIKLAGAERGKLLQEDELFWNIVRLDKPQLPNTIVEGDNADEAKLKLELAFLSGSLTDTGETDEYYIKLRKGQTFSTEFNGFDVAVGDPVIGALKLYYITYFGERVLIAQNFQNFEGFDAFLIDAPIEKSGIYILEVSSPNEVSFGYNADGTPDLFQLDENGFGDLRNGDYYLNMYATLPPKPKDAE